MKKAVEEKIISPSKANQFLEELDYLAACHTFPSIGAAPEFMMSNHPSQKNVSKT
jgi:hypothetical protein